MVSTNVHYLLTNTNTFSTNVIVKSVIVKHAPLTSFSTQLLKDVITHQTLKLHAVSRIVHFISYQKYCAILIIWNPHFSYSN